MTIAKPSVRPDVKNSKLLSIEAARGLAAVIVVFYHAARHLKADFGFLPWHGVAQFGHTGVDFFFVLSGFIIFFVHRKDLGKPNRLLGYFERRFTRIYPYYWISLCIGMLLVFVAGKQRLIDAGFIFLSATLLPIDGDVGVAWTLQHEILFYLIFAVAIINRRIGLGIFSGWLGFIIWNWMFRSVPYNVPFIDRLSAPVNIEFFFGIFAAFLVQEKLLKSFRLFTIMGSVFFLGFGIAEDFHVFNGYDASARIAFGLSSMLIVAGIAGANLHGFLKSPRILVSLGSASYSIYLFHLVCIGVIYKLMSLAGLLTVIPVTMLYVILVSAGIGGGIVLSRLIEFPLLNVVRRSFGIVQRYRMIRA